MSSGGWAQIAYTGVKDWFFALGGGVDNPWNANVPSGGRLCNRFVFTNLRYNLTRQLQIGAEYAQYKTDYRGPDGVDNRVQFSVIYSF